MDEASSSGFSVTTDDHENLLIVRENCDLEIDHDLSKGKPETTDSPVELLLKEIVQSACVSVLVEGCSGSGKTHLIGSVAKSRGLARGDGFTVVHLSEHIDGKVLLGTLTCTSTPGEFVWIPGLLTKAVSAGEWLLLEDIDCAPPDVLSILLPLIKSRELVIPGYHEPLQISKDFKLFLTTRSSGPASPLVVLLSQHSIVFHLDAMLSSEVKKIIVTMYPSLKSLARQLVTTLTAYDLDIRHLLKFCARIAMQVHNSYIQAVEDCMLEVIDCFCGHLPVSEISDSALQLAPLCGGLAREKVEQLCTTHKPSLQLSPTTLVVGRAYLQRSPKTHPEFVYAHTQRTLRLLEVVCRCVQMSEPVLLVGETGVGKTAAVNYLAAMSGNKLTVVNMSEHTDSVDLLGGFKPVDVSQLIAPVRTEYEVLFHSTFSVAKNAVLLTSIQTCFVKQKWRKMFRLMVHSSHSALAKLQSHEEARLCKKWKLFSDRVTKLRDQMVKSTTTFAFRFVEGALIKALRNGEWILLDEINLATSETLQCLSSLIEGADGSFVVAERGESQPVERHPDFRLFCCMNPATDVGKKSLPASIRNRFTESFVDEIQSTQDLRLLVQSYLKNTSLKPPLVDGIIKLYRAMKDLAERQLLNGTGQKPHYSLRNLCRALRYATDVSHSGNLLRGLFEGFCLTMLSELKQDHHAMVVALIQQCLSISDAVTKRAFQRPTGHSCVSVEGFWLARGGEPPPAHDQEDYYVLTKSVKRNLRNLARAVSARCYPVLLQGPTSAGKTSLVQYLARLTGHKCFRINNHEHTDLQDYIGMYTADQTGRLVFQEGVLVDAMRNGYWIILDELNLAPTEVLEALNRVLDDNRELFIPETQQLVKAHPEFLLFGTQNPPGLYGGRKVLSRAFRNRFIELHVEDIPSDELATILQKRCKLPPSYSKKMVAVMTDLQLYRSVSGVFAGKYGLITLRDMFRWAERYRMSTTEETFFDWDQLLAEDGYMLLGGRVRSHQEEATILEVIQKHFKCAVSPAKLFGLDGGNGSCASQLAFRDLQKQLPHNFRHLVLTPEFLRVAVLVHRALQFDEPVLLVGNTGCGKTTLCQLIAELLQRKCYSINCHMHTEAADLLGGLRPIRNRTETAGLFEWKDGVVVLAMMEGECLLVDEISLADDAVLERLNSVLEPERTLLISEKSRGQGEVLLVTAASGFTFMATMNPGGDYGKKELSLALRNRFVEIWCPDIMSKESCKQIVEHNLKAEILTEHPGLCWSELMLDVAEKLRNTSPSVVVSVRDLLAWVKFMNTCHPKLDAVACFYHGAHLVFLDALGEEPRLKIKMLTYLEEALCRLNLFVEDCGDGAVTGCTLEGTFGVSPFYIPCGPVPPIDIEWYTFDAPGPHENSFRILRAMQLGKPLLLEGPPGVGKTSLVTALALASGNRVTRINLSEHTDIADLFGSDLPEVDAKRLVFSWRDGSFLKALRNGDWILLDEMNLASQSVLEGLNACLDHRGEVYIPELGRQFQVQPGTRLFACQNPLQQGFGRKGLPKSFVNRFTKVYVDSLTSKDLLYIASVIHPNLDSDVLRDMIAFNENVKDVTQAEYGFSSIWDFNLRDVLKWCELMIKFQKATHWAPGQFVELVYCSRLRTAALRSKVRRAFMEVFGEGCGPIVPLGACFHTTGQTVQCGSVVLEKQSYFESSDPPLVLLHCQLPAMEVLMACVEMGWMAVLVGDSCCGKSSIVRSLAQLTGHKLLELPMNSNTDTTELLGGFEQVNYGRKYGNLSSVAHDVIVWMKCVLRKQRTTQQSVAYSRELQRLADSLRRPDKVDSDSVCALFVELQVVVKRLQEIGVESNIQHPYDLAAVLLDVQRLVDAAASDSLGQFEWVDSVLVHAMKHGHWLLLSHANFCSSSVLDRLNPVLEPNGVLTIDERGVGNDGTTTVKPHSDFRLFLTMDPAHGEISKAIRNRGIELFIASEDSLKTVQGHCDDLVALLLAAGADRQSALDLLRMCPRTADFTPVRLLQWSQCRQISQKYTCHGLIQKVLNYPQSDSCVEPEDLVVQPYLTVADCFLDPLHCIVYRDLAGVVQCWNNSHRSSTNDCPADPIQASWKLHAALEVYYSASSVEDCVARTSALDSVQALISESGGTASVQVLSWVKALKEHLQKVSWMKSSQALSGLDATSVINSSMWCICMKMGVLLALIQSHVKLCRPSQLPSVLVLSNGTSNGTVPLELLLHSSLQCVYPFLHQLLSTLKGSSGSNDLDINLSTVHKLCRSCDVLLMFVRVCMSDSYSLALVATAWTLLTEALEGFSALRSDWQDLQLFAVELQQLEVFVKQAKLYSTFRSKISQSIDIKSNLQCEEPQARKSFVSKVDFALTPLVFAMKKLAVSLLCREIAFSQSDRTSLAHFLSLIAKFASEPHLVYLKNSLENCEEKPSSLRQLLPILLEFCYRKSSSSLVCESACSTAQFKLLPVYSRHSTWKDRVGAAAVTVGSYVSKTEELRENLQCLWLSGMSDVYNPSKSIELEYGLAKEILNWLLCAISSTFCKTDMIAGGPSEENVRSVCNDAAASFEVGKLQQWNTFAQHMLSALNSLNNVRTSQVTSTDLISELQTLCHLSVARAHIGSVFTSLLCPTRVDPISVSEAERKCSSLIICHLSGLWEAWNTHYRLMIGKTMDKVFPRGSMPASIASLLQRKTEWERAHTEQGVACVREPTEPSYHQMVDACTDLVTSLFSPARVETVLGIATDSTASALEREKVASWICASSSAIDTVKSRFSEYPDVVVPFVMGMVQVVDGIGTAFYLSKQSEDWNVSLVNTMTRIVQYCSSYESMLDHVKALNSKTLQGSSDFAVICNKRLRLLAVALSKCCLQKLPGSCRLKWRAVVGDLLKQCWELWHSADQESRRLAREREKSYRYKSQEHCVQDDAVTAQELFPSYEREFADMDPQLRSDGVISAVVEENSTAIHVQFDDAEMHQICSLHAALFSCESSSYTSEHTPSWWDAFKYAYQLTSYLSDKAKSLPGLGVDYKLLPAHVRMCSSVLNMLESRSEPGEQEHRNSFNIYKQPMVCEVKKSFEVVSQLLRRIEVLLVEWPDHPTLMQIMMACEKTLSLGIEEPVMKVLTGVEYVLKKAQDWETYAAAHVSLSSELQLLTGLVTHWRKLELNSWSHLLSTTAAELRVSSSVWWFHLYSLCCNKQDCDKDFVSAILKFAETATLGEFGSRLEMLEGFHLDMVAAGNSSMASVLGNAVLYFSQVVSTVDSSIKELVAPIEKEMKDYVSVLRWNDGNYWALKSAAEKSHDKLLKLISKYKAVLGQPVLPVLTNSSLLGTGRETVAKSSQLEGYVDVLSSVSFCSKIDRKVLECVKSIPIVVGDSFEAMEISSSNAFARMMLFVKKLSSMSLCATWCLSVDGLAGDIIEAVHQLQSHEYLSGLDATKRKAAIKLSNVHKRKSLSDLFKALKIQGLSYRKGTEFDQEFRQSLFQIPVASLPTQLSSFTNPWEDAQKYYYSCVARMASFSAAFSSPSKELTADQLARCKGYASGLLSLIAQQRLSLGSGLSNLPKLLAYLERMELLLDGTSAAFQPNQYQSWLGVLCTSLEQCLETVSNLDILMKSIPEEFDFSVTPFSKENFPPIISCGNKTVAEHAMCLIQKHESELKQLYAKFCKKERYWECVGPQFSTRSEVNDLEAGFAAVEAFCTSVGEALSHSFGEKPSSFGLFEFLYQLASCLLPRCDSFGAWMREAGQTTISHDTCDTSTAVVEGLTRSMLLSVQKILLRHSDLHSPTNEDSDFAHCKHLLAVLSDDLTSMMSDQVLDELANLFSGLLCTSAEISVDTLLAAYPILHQYCQLYQRIVVDMILAHRTLCKLLNILLNVFAALVTEGFCTPPEDSESQETETLIDQKAGGFDEGLAGTQNVSSEAEASNLDAGGSSDQSQENQEQRGGSEEEDTVDVSEDFSGALEDVAEGGESDDQSDHSEEEQDCDDHEVGNMEDSKGEELDRNMWAKDPKEEQEKEPQNLEEGAGTAVNDEEQMVAKDGNTELEESKNGTDDLETAEQEMDIDHNTSGLSDNEDEDYGNLDFDAQEDESCEGSGTEQPGEEEEEEEDSVMEDGEAEEHNAAAEESHKPEDIEVQAYSMPDNTTDANAGAELSSEVQKESGDPASEGMPASAHTRDSEGTSTAPFVPEKTDESSAQRRPRSQAYEDRWLADSSESVSKRPKLVDALLEREDHVNQDTTEDSSVYEHLPRDATGSCDAVVWDAMDQERAETQHQQHDTDAAMLLERTEEKMRPKESHIDERIGDSLKTVAEDEPSAAEDPEGNMEEEDNDAATVAQKMPQTQSYFVTRDIVSPKLNADALRSDLEVAISVLHQSDESASAPELWMQYELLTASLSQQLCEELRIILKPTKASQLKGDFRSGKRLNMRRIIPYIASNFQNDRIWLRRTKPSQRIYQIMIAVDDSSSMHDNNCKQMAYESLALISSALTRLDSGQLGICKFGEDVTVLHPLEHPFSSRDGGHILQNLTFSQSKTNFSMLLQAAVSMFSKCARRAKSFDVSQLLVILSDGRGVYAEGTLPVQLAMRRVTEMGVFTVFIILDDVCKDSIIDIKVPTFIPGKQPIIKSYLETFPFPFYIVLRDIEKLPNVLGDALRQWFEVMSTKQ